ncbi:glycoside hydrolase family 38 C-terminal domain-containing protein [Cohnella sp. WQ 127256]|uniref:alpha-mannosidase n=1 Tax=Cohnella sp. WQ 127256 TaxID=2938790 RepID=UPI0021173E4F|nr:glycoside hydrolase family 38 C-terminal domain-containing protein [Cohnella sp. WQ 127256]
MNDQKRWKLHVISHTHWDREWYQTFQGFRKRLVYMMDELIEVMENNADYKYFHLDGQTIIIEDYLQIRPDNEERLRKLIREGRILIGPWYVMPDEFLVSGESLVRNFQRGFAMSADYGVEPMKNGYVTDIFGHNSQFPQILQQFGISSATLYRGIGDYEKDLFEWEGADGSRVYAIKLDRERSYSNFYFAIRRPFEGSDYDSDELVSRMQQLLEFSRPLAVSDQLLMMDGVDHCEIEPRLPELISLFRERFDNVEVEHSRLEDYLAAQLHANPKLDTIKGELYNVANRGVNNQVLKNVLSSMVHLKQMNQACETLLTRWTEPFGVAASFIKPHHSDGFMTEAWKYLLQNHPHDSICGCSITRVHQDNEYRFQQVDDIGNELLEQYLQNLVSAMDTRQTGTSRAIVLFNASQNAYDAGVQVNIELPEGSQGMFKIMDDQGHVVPYQLIRVQRNVTRKVAQIRMLIDFVKIDIYTVIFKARIPAIGYSLYGFEEYRNVPPGQGDYTFLEYHAPIRYLGSMQIDHKTWDNGKIQVSIQENGTLRVVNLQTGKEYRDLLIFEDNADVGDGWNYRKPVRDSRLLSLGGKASVSVEYEGPLAVQWKIIHVINVPVRMKENGLERADVTVPIEITTYVGMNKDSTMLDFKTVIDNRAAEHRVRVLFPTDLSTDRFYTSTPFYLQDRDVGKIDWSEYVEAETGVSPNQGLVWLKEGDNGLALYNKGLYEVEVTEDRSRTIALTLFRSFRNEVGRDEGEMSYMFREMSFEYALDFRDGLTNVGDIVAEGDGWRAGIKAVCTDSHEGALSRQQSFLSINVPGAILSAYKSGKEGMKIIRLYNCTDQHIEGNVQFYESPKHVFCLNLNEEVEGLLQHSGKNVHVSLIPAQILTIGYVC